MRRIPAANALSLAAGCVRTLAKLEDNDMECQPASDVRRFESLYRMMVLIRRFEERIAGKVEEGAIPTPCHFCIGQEAIAAGVCAALERRDCVWGAHRSHGHYLAKGGDVAALFAEIFCRAAGCAGGRGGSMHVCDHDAGVMGTVPIVAATIPIAVGAGLAFKLRGEDRVSVAFFGDGATEEGHFHESLNLAGIQCAPVVFVCENNLYSSHMEIHERRLRDNIPDSGAAHGIPADQVDGNDVLAVRAAAAAAIARARLGQGPTLLECRTFRWRGHVGPSWDIDVGVRRKDELQQWLPKDPIARFASWLEEHVVDAAALRRIERDVERELSAAMAAALECPPPDPASVNDHVYANDGGMRCAS
jgi:pyruvate dehydrogenase E1 component alpha subunit